MKRVTKIGMVQPQLLDYFESVRRGGIEIRPLPFKAEDVPQVGAFSLASGGLYWVYMLFYQPVAAMLSGSVAVVVTDDVVNEGSVEASARV